ncbi:Uncharacterised protein [Yersinia nurmii]|uniref:Uncharacterized protein n=1 Tax=Yersinia nurmii TaxID=685706 RepID=A0ABP1Y8S1_9GAMM|nr:Uncharacterised protein [Yersinia nurmii]
MFGSPKTLTELLMVGLCVLISLAFLKVYLF